MNQESLTPTQLRIVEDAVDAPAMGKQYKTVAMSAGVTIVLLVLALLQNVSTTGIALLAMVYVVFTAIEKWRYLGALKMYRQVIAKLAEEE